MRLNLRLRLLELLFPRKCMLCRRPLPKYVTELCHSCRKDAPWVPDLREHTTCLDRRTALWYYEGHVCRCLRRFKFFGARSYAEGFAHLLIQRMEETDFPAFDLLTWVPISPRRRFFRGYDQVELLAIALGKEFGITPVRLLKKVRNTPPQSGISDPAARRANVLGAFQAVNTALLQDKQILLLDDIITTGATSSECARILLIAGARSVTCAAIARGVHDLESSR